MLFSGRFCSYSSSPLSSRPNSSLAGDENEAKTGIFGEKSTIGIAYACFWAGFLKPLQYKNLEIIDNFRSKNPHSIRASGQTLYNSFYYIDLQRFFFKRIRNVQNELLKNLDHLRASGQEKRALYVPLGRKNVDFRGWIRASGQEYTCLWAGIYVLLGRNKFLSGCNFRTCNFTTINFKITE